MYHDLKNMNADYFDEFQAAKRGSIGMKKVYKQA